ncbi:MULTISPECIES: hypothetical protein [Bacillus]|uniref:hypothetical protein n=1 Tax=Bacillus TaxID=1386 RepID=UPI000BF10BD6|nr:MULTISPECIES: hypothetical protein [Bacillus]MCS3594980.1 hypothetical protein [Bacillus sp. JUb91]PEJ06329.1 hypothetical protein CN671_02990 [Bacillus toyonensis]PFZ76266.1 hypothetical protein COL72_02410 [Bacillus toyonensis]TBX47819.1 hypothetical protein E0M44_14185 [Bacillus toyonensis]
MRQEIITKNPFNKFEGFRKDNKQIDILSNEINILPIYGNSEIERMKRQNVHSAMGVLKTLFYMYQDTKMGIRTMECYVEMGLLEDTNLVAETLKKTRCCDLLHVIKLFDFQSAEQIEHISRGNPSTY